MKSSPCFMGKRLAGRIVCLRSLPEREGLQVKIVSLLLCKKKTAGSKVKDGYSKHMVCHCK